MNTADKSLMPEPSTIAHSRHRLWLRRALVLLAWLVTLIALFYGEENWRGKRAWEKCRRELEAKGQVLDWNAYIPAPVPNDQNIFKAPKMTEWFVKGPPAATVSGKPAKSTNSNTPFSLAPSRDAKDGPVLVAEVAVVLSNGPLPPGKADAVLRLDDPAAREQAAKLLREHIGPCVEGAQNNVIIARPLDQIKPAILVVQADTVPTPKALAELFSRVPVPHPVVGTSDANSFLVVPAGSNIFRVSLKSPVYTPADYLTMSQPAEPDFNLLRMALERPCARMDGDYERPFALPLPDFVRLRTVAQLLSGRAQSYLLLDQPEAAWHELALVRDVCRLLEAKPTGNAPTLVQAMIDVAITGFYTQVIADGLRLQVWREPELAAMQKQLADINLLPLVHEAMSVERSAVCRAFELAPPAKFKEWSISVNIPRGWIYQNMCTLALLDQLYIDSFDLPNNQVLPRKADEIKNQIETAFRQVTPYTFLARIGVPNFVKATYTLARTQTRVNEAYLACGLERYRLAHGQYPETLDALVPQFAEKLPHDIIGGQPLKYHLTADGQFVLYSVGWDEKDDGGVSGKSLFDDKQGDWVWEYPAK
jgi:hypothetical protein